MICLPVSDSSQVSDARRRIAAFAESLGFEASATARASLIITELATNLIKHGNGGVLLAEVDSYSNPPALELLALDRGEGMLDVDQCMRDGYTTIGSPGTGLGAIHRQSHVLEIYSQPGAGAAIYVRSESGRIPPPAVEKARSFGAVCLPKIGEDANGDAWAAAGTAENRTYLVVDGLGHGVAAAEAAKAAVQEFNRCADASSITEILTSIHEALRHTRGAAVAVARTDESREELLFGGIGNIGGAIITDGNVRKTVSRNGTAGLTVRRIQEYSYPFTSGSTFFMYSDGLVSSWNCAGYPGLLARHPLLIAGVLFRDFRRDRDDVTILVAHRERP